MIWGTVLEDVVEYHSQILENIGMRDRKRCDEKAKTADTAYKKGKGSALGRNRAVFSGKLNNPIADIRR